jgi:Na+:H+ antiporter, NhaA family
MIMETSRKIPLEKWIIDPLQRFIQNSTTSGIVLFSAAILALIISNSPLSESYHQFWELKFSVGFNNHTINKSLHHWINDGLMAIFFFVVGLELKREILAGELNSFKKAMLPVSAAIGGMIAPALIYFVFNSTGTASNGWGIPMATDIAFALGVLYLLGDKVPISLKIFLTALAIVDDIGAVLVIAFFYTSQIDLVSLAIGGGFLLVLIVSNLVGVRNTLYYGFIGIGGLWLAFLMSGIHATIAAVLAAMTIPAGARHSEQVYLKRLKILVDKFEREKPNDRLTLTDDQLHIVEEIRNCSKLAMPPLQRLEHSMHPLVAFVIMPVFALCNAGITFSDNFISNLSHPVFLGIFLGLLIGKVLGVSGLIYILTKLKWVRLPESLNNIHLLGAGFLAAIGFTMSLFIGGLAFDDQEISDLAKMGILCSSFIASIAGFFIISYANRLSCVKK